MNLSYWEKEYWHHTYDYLIIGAGIVGLTTAMYLTDANPEASILLVEAGTLPSGASTKNAGFTCFATVGEIIDDLNYNSEEDVINTIQARWQGLQRLHSLTSEANINYKKTGGTEVFLSEDEYEFCYDQLLKVNTIIEAATGIKNVIASQKLDMQGMYKNCLYNRYEGQLNPVLLIKSFIKKLQEKGVSIIYDTRVSSFQTTDTTVEVLIQDQKKLLCKNLVVCTNAFTPQLIDIKDVVPARNQVLVTEPIPDLSIEGTYHYNKGFVYYRNIGQDRILIGGARHIDAEEEQTSDFGSNALIINYLIDFLKSKILGHSCSIDYKWSGIIATGTSKQPIISKIDDRIYAGVRLGGMGIAIGSNVGFELSQLLRETY
jgi:glycine/D-amino acid oxidase-like deaminating enzyme